MRCFAWDTKGTCADLSGLLPPLEGGKAILDSRFYAITDPSDKVEYLVFVYDRAALIPVDYDEAQATEEFLKLIHTIILPCGV